MANINILPLVNAIIGILLSIFIFTKKSGLGQKKATYIVLGLLMLILSYVSLDYFLYLNNYEEYAGYSSLFGHLIGFLFFYFICLFTDTTFDSKKWIGIIITYTLIRFTFLIPYMVYETLDHLLQALETNYFLKYVLISEHILVPSINILLIAKAFFVLKKASTAIKPSEKQKAHLKWIQLLILAIIILILNITISTLLTLIYHSDYHSFFLFETVIFTLFFFTLIFSLLQFPVFVFSGDYNDLIQTKALKKYKKSSLTDSSLLFEKIESLVREKELYLQQNLKLDTLAQELETSIHHISQAINENAQKSFPDYINTFRIEIAKQKLAQSNSDTIFAIAIDSGFNSKANFYYVFKKFTEQTPTQFRKDSLS